MSESFNFNTDTKHIGAELYGDGGMGCHPLVTPIPAQKTVLFNSSFGLVFILKIALHQHSHTSTYLELESNHHISSYLQSNILTLQTV